MSSTAASVVSIRVKALDSLVVTSDAVGDRAKKENIDLDSTFRMTATLSLANYSYLNARPYKYQNF